MPMMRKRFITTSLCPGGCAELVTHRVGEAPEPCFPCQAATAAERKVRDEAMKQAADAAYGTGFAQVGPEGVKAVPFAEVMKTDDPGAHYRWEIRRRITDEDIARGWVRVKLDPYRICQVAGVGGGPHEHAVKKLLRGEAKGHEARALIREARACLDRWEEMIAEDEEEARCR